MDWVLTYLVLGSIYFLVWSILAVVLIYSVIRAAEDVNKFKKNIVTGGILRVAAVVIPTLMGVLRLVRKSDRK
jgi:hypothetical protein